eukprot:TRINITY_DN14587_c0_g1_i1.p1 TRINITY_DN14587_c0_g1~~TRINITY_DN14587_c0_g1_i1.p1  ORF type:complete len:1011 (-),score=277.45 TRINITY_DN14587_c0_g1_i1:51-3083(-)
MAHPNDADLDDLSDEEMNSSSSDDDSDEENLDVELSDEEEEDEEELEQVTDEEYTRRKEEVTANSWNYNAWISWISALRSRKEHAQVKEARRSMHNYFPLSEDLWFEWIKDELRQAKNNTQRQDVAKICKIAVEDYISVKIWLQYGHVVETMFYKSIDEEEEETTADQVRSMWENAISAVGSHVAEGDQIWKAFRSFETRMLEELEAMGAIQPAAEKIVTQQRERVRKLYRRQLAIPLIGMEATYKEYIDWEKKSGGDSKQIQQEYKQALGQLQERLPFEERIKSKPNVDPASGGLDYTKLEDWKQYIAFEKTSKDPARVISVYERAIKDFCLVFSLWQEYLQFLQESFSSSAATMVLPTYKRAVRNCPWSGWLWAAYMRALEAANKQESEIMKIFEEGLVAGLQSPGDALELFQTLIDYHVRRMPRGTDEDREYMQVMADHVRAAFARANQYFIQYFPDQGYSEQIERNWANIEAFRLFDLSKSRELYENVLKSYGSSAEIWREFIDAEMYGKNEDDDDDDTDEDTKLDNVRKLFRRALGAVSTDSIEKIAERWLTFERTWGTLEQFQTAVSRTQAKLAEANILRTSEDQVAEMNKRAAQEAERRESRRQSIQRNKQSEQREPQQLNRRARREAARKEAAQREDPRERKERKERTERTERQNRGNDQNKRKRSDDDRSTTRPAKELKSDKPPQASTPAVEAPQQAASSEKRTIFVSSMSFEVNDTDLKELFGTFGTITDVRIATDNEGKSKGYAFIDFSTPEEAQKALVNDKLNWKDRQINVALSMPRGERGPKHSERMTLFVANLDFTLKEEEVREFFEQIGKVRELRMPKDQFGKHKGYAYVELEDEESFDACLERHQVLLKNRPIQIKPSAPPAPGSKKETEEKESSRGRTKEGREGGGRDNFSRGGGGGRRGLGAERGRGFSKPVFVKASKSDDIPSHPTKHAKQKLMIPRTLKANAATAAKDEAVAMDVASSTPADKPSSTTSSSSGTGMSNADFRKLLLSGKK